MLEESEDMSINKYQVDVTEITNDWNSLYIIVDPTDPDGDIKMSSKGLGGEGVYFSKAMIPLLIQGLQSLVGDNEKY